ncbi:MAG: 6-phosphogluconolactonase [Solirubrobacteraceae bacterium]|jgi:6-phosphogluconolactonase|nr:6-phosphogluconolactonase [Solirubrobacteraceae bacterium]
MSEPVVTRAETSEEAAERTAEVMATLIDAARTVRGVAHVALSGGSSIAQTYRLLGPRLPDWRDVHLWYGDERCVPLDDPESTHRLATGTLDAPGATWHPLAVELGCDEAAARYAEELDGTVLDVALNGMGPDGHTASLFPGHPALRAEGIAVPVHDSPKPPPDRMTLTLGKLNESRRILLLVTGAEKAPMLARVLAGPDPDVPASLLARDRLEVIADSAALGG